MDIKPYDRTIRDLLGSKRQFIIPRFQREYSWEKKNYQEFYEDMLFNLSVKDGKIVANQYFLGTMLFIGNFSEGTEQEIQVVDGQQRLTTITILFSAISDRFLELGENTLSKQVFSYIMTEDDNGNEVRVLKSSSSYPYFAFFIQDKNKRIPQEANSEEENCIKEAYDYFRSELSLDNLRMQLSRKYGTDIVDSLTEIEIIKALRDQVLNSTFVSISTTDRNQANRIFEILNAKGKRLADIDLIKNRIFEVLNKEEPADYAEETWKEIKNTLNSGDETVGLATFYRHYWVSKYKLTYSSKLYDQFSKEVRKSEESYTTFLEDLLKNARTYMKIVNPNRADYDNRKEYFWLVQSLHIFSNIFNVVQVRIALLSLFEIKEKGIIDLKVLKRTIIHMENFHFTYNALLSGRPNRVEKIYSAFAIKVRKALDKPSALNIIKESLIEPLDALFPEYDEFAKRFIALTYTKSDSSSNMKVKYIINKLNCYYSGKELFEDDGSIEHIVSEQVGGNAVNIGNLILLEKDLNTVADNKEYQEKKTIYQQSNYKWIQQFVNEHGEWDQAMIESRANDMAKLYYTEILNREIGNG